MTTPHSNTSTLPLPRRWKDQIKSTILHVLALANFTFNLAQSEAVENQNCHPLELRLLRMEAELARVKEIMRIKDQRMSRLSAFRRPHFTPLVRRPAHRTLTDFGIASGQWLVAPTNGERILGFTRDDFQLAQTG